MPATAPNRLFARPVGGPSAQARDALREGEELVFVTPEGVTLVLSPGGSGLSVRAEFGPVVANTLVVRPASGNALTIRAEPA